MIQHPALSAYEERFRDLTFQPLVVQAHLVPGTRVGGYDPINLDNLLAYAVVQAATAGQGVPTSAEAYDIPLPLLVLWRAEDGLPLWASTQFQPAGPAITDTHYWHKRAQTGRFTATERGTFAIRSTQGRYMERRVPLPVTVTETLVARCIGHAETILELLAHVSHLGKRRSMGLGEVSQWSVASATPDHAFTLVAERKLTRSLPAEAGHLIAPAVPDEVPVLIGWTPPQWKHTLWRPGWRAGADVH